MAKIVSAPVAAGIGWAVDADGEADTGGTLDAGAAEEAGATAGELVGEEGDAAGDDNTALGEVAAADETATADDTDGVVELFAAEPLQATTSTATPVNTTSRGARSRIKELTSGTSRR